MTGTLNPKTQGKSLHLGGIIKIMLVALPQESKNAGYATE